MPKSKEKKILNVKEILNWKNNEEIRTSFLLTNTNNIFAHHFTNYNIEIKNELQILHSLIINVSQHKIRPI